MSGEAGKIVDSELEVMKLLWSRGEPVPVAEIIETLTAKIGWKEPTVKTLVRNLREKGSIRVVERGVYEAVVTEEEYNEYSTRSLIGKLFDGSAKRLVASLVSDGQLSQKDIAELYAELFRGREQ